MPKPALIPEHLRDEEAAYAWVEAHLWPNGPVCPHCGGTDRIRPMKGRTTRIGLKKCYACRKPFNVKVGTVFEASHIPLHLWLQAIFLMCSSKKGVSSNQVHRTLGITLKSAWFLSHRIRTAMREDALPPMGGQGGVVEADETYYGSKDVVSTRTRRGKPGLASKRAILALVERGGGVRSLHVERATKADVMRAIAENVSAKAKLHTDESNLYRDAHRLVAEHDSVHHSSGEYVRGEVHTNSVEGFFSIFKRGMKGIYQHCSEKHLHRYLAEFDFRYTNRAARGVDDAARTSRAVRGVAGKRLTYRTTAGG